MFASLSFGRMRMYKGSLYHLGHWDLYCKNTEGPKLPLVCLHHRHRVACAMGFGPANSIHGLLPTPYFFALRQLANTHGITGHWLV